MPFTVQHLIAGRSEPFTVMPHEPVQKALELMIEHDFSQLPVIDKDRRPLGMITSDSTLRALSNFGLTTDALRVSNAMVKAVKFRPEDDLFEMLDDLRDTYAVLIVNGEDRLIGIVTSYDTTGYFRRRAEDIMLVEDIESNLKDHVLAAFADVNGEVDTKALSEVIKVVGRFKRADQSFDELTLGEYINLFLHERHWNQFGAMFDLPPEAVQRLLNNVRQIRNLLAHFRGEISATQRAQLRFCADWLARYQTLLVRDLGHTQEQTVVALEDQAPLATEESGVAPTAEELKPDDSRYAPLALWLQGQPIDQDRVTLTFEQIEGIINSPLPSSARQHRSWWANDAASHVQSQQWLEVGWRVAGINMTEERVTFVRIRERERAYIDFFSALLSDLSKVMPFKDRVPSPDGQSWITIGWLPESKLLLPLAFAFSRGARFRVELYIDTGDKAQNKFLFDTLHNRLSEIELAVGSALSWERLDDKRASRLALYYLDVSIDESKALQDLRTWAADAMVRFKNALNSPVADAVSIMPPKSEI